MDHQPIRPTLLWTELGSSDTVSSPRAGRTSSFLLPFLNNRVRGEELFTPILHGGPHQSFHGGAAVIARQISPIHGPKWTELHADWNDVRAGATPPFAARCVTGFVRSLPPSQELRVAVLSGCMLRPKNLSDETSDTL
jgi:hypothetical protein